MVTIGARTLAGDRCYVIAEAGVNHNGDVAIAHALVDAAADAGADAVKFQTFVAARLVTADTSKADYQRQRTGGAESQRDMLRRLELSPGAHAELRDHCGARGVDFLSTPFDEVSVDLLESLGIAAFKVPSGEITNVPLLTHVASKRRPVLLSTGMSSLADVRVAVEALRRGGCSELALLQCTSAYPADPSTANLRAMQTMRAEFGVPVGYSDHTLGITVPLAAVALGAAVIEKHLTLDRTMAGPDHEASLEPAAFAEMARGIRTVARALGDGVKRPTDGEIALARVVRRSLVAARDLAAGTRLTAAMLAAKRPGTGVPPTAIDSVIGRTLRRAIAADTVLEPDMLEEGGP